MSSDISRQRFDPHQDFSAVLMQQGRVLLDADWNEWTEILQRRIRAETTDIIGRAVVPKQTPQGFQIGVSNGNLTIGPGRIYVDGLLAENHGKPPYSTLDPILAETTSATPLPYKLQPPFLSDGAQVPPLPQTPGPHLVYLDVWDREVTPAKNPDLIENAVGVDTTTRLQTAWQVRVIADVGAGVTCATPDAAIPKWVAATKPSAGRLTTGAVHVAADPDPCLIPPSGNYRGLENRLYRVEIHDAGAPGVATFTWARHNGSIVTPIESFQGRTIVVTSTGRDADLRFSVGDWVEITDDVREFQGQPGVICKVTDVNDAKRTLLLSADVSASFPKAERHPRVRRWDQKGRVRDGAGNVVFDLDGAASQGVIPIKHDGDTFMLEDGVTVTFHLDPAGGTYRQGDYWVFAARTADASVEKLTKAPPRGIHHHYARLAVITFPNTVADCRVFWPPAFGGDDHCCECTVCVTPQQHASGQLTIQQALDSIRSTGGTVCLTPGFYDVTQVPLTITGGRGVRLRGQGAATVLTTLAKDPALTIKGGLGVTIEDLLVLSAGVTSKPAEFVVTNSMLVTIQRCYFAQMSALTDAAANVVRPLAIGLAGFVLAANLRENSIIGGRGIGRVGGGTDQKTTPLLSFGLRVENNNLFCRRNGVVFDGMSIHLEDTRISGNRIQSTAAEGILATGVVLPLINLGTPHLEISQNTLQVLGDGIVFGTSNTRVTENDLSAVNADQKGDGIALTRGLIGGAMDSLVTNNRIRGIHGAGIALKTLNVRTSIDGNTVIGTPLGGIVSGGELAISRSLRITANQIAEIVSSAELKPSGSLASWTKSSSEVSSALAGISLYAVIDGEIAHNRIDRVTTPPESAYSVAGIRVAAGSAVRIADNSVVNLEGGREAGADGILVLDVTDQLQIHGNNIRAITGNAALEEALSKFGWRAIRLGAILTSADFDKESKSDEKTKSTIDSLTAVRGNVINGSGASPSVMLRTTAHCIFAENQVQHATETHSPLVLAKTETLIFSSNHLIRRTDDDVLLAQALRVTALGNVLSGKIKVLGLLKPAAWQDFNAHV